MRALYKVGLRLLVAWVALCLAGCGAVAWPMPISDTLQGMRRAASGGPGTFAYMRESRVVLGWAAGQDKVAVILLDSTGKLLKIGELSNTKLLSLKSAAEFAQWAAGNGWKAVPASGLPVALVGAINQAGYLVALGSAGLPSVLLIPAAILEQKPLQLLSDGGGA